MSIVKTVAEAQDYVVRILTGKGVPEENAITVADSLVYADARGTRSHGINMLEAYLKRIDDGGIDTSAQPKILREDACMAVVDACNGFGQVGVQGLTDVLLEKAGHAAVVCGSVRRLNHCGALAYYTEQCARQGYIAFLFVNANPTVAPFGAMEAALGTNPMSIAIPNGESPLVLDMASSAVAKAKIYHAAKTGQKIDPCWALDAEGNPTDDPQKAINGVLTTMAGPKGYGIALAVEAMAGVLSGAGITDEVCSVHKRTDRGMDAGGFLILVDPRRFLEPEEYALRMEKLVADMRQARPQPGRQVFLPGEIELRQLLRAQVDGIEYDEVFFNSFLEVIVS